MRNLLKSIGVFRYYFLLVLLSASTCIANAQDLYSFIDSCSDCCGKIKTIKTRHKVNFLDYNSSVVRKTEEYNTNDQLVKTEITINRVLSKTINYFYKDSLLVYEKHILPGEDSYFLFYQYYKRNLPTKIIKVDLRNRILNYSELEYTEDFIPVFLKSYNLMGEMLEKRSVEYYSKNQVVIKSFYPKSDLSYLQRHELLCKFNEPEKLKKKDFKDLVTKPINVEFKDNLVRVVKAVQQDKKEKVQIEEISYDNYGNWTAKKTYELKNNKNKRRLVNQIEREIEYY